MAREDDVKRHQQATAELNALKAIKSTKASDGKTVYIVNGIEYTTNGYNNLVKEKEKEVRRYFYYLNVPTPVQEADIAALRGQAGQQREQINVGLVRIREAKKLIDESIPRAQTADEQRNLEAWSRIYAEKEKEFTNALSSLASDRPLPTVPTLPKIVTVQNARRSVPAGVSPVAAAPAQTGTQPTTPTGSAAGGNAPVPGVVYGGMPGTGGGVQQVDLSSVNFPETPAEVTTTTPATTPAVTTTTTAGTSTTTTPGTTPGMGTQPPATGPAYVDPATGVSVQPGGQIGGEDRALPNGGAVVNGVYIPPGIDYTALGQAMQAAGIPIPAEWEKAAREMFGSWYDVFKNDPEMSAFLQRLMREPEMSDAMFQAELQKTNWWRTTNASARNFARLQVEDPATLNTQIANKTAALRQEALARGFTVADAALNDAALKSIQFGFSDQVVLNHLAQLTIEQAQGPSSLVQGFYGQSVRETAAQYGIPLSETTLTKWVSDIATGNQSINSFDAYARDLARNLYPSLAKGFDSGLTFGQMTNPYAQVASSILEVPATTIDFTDPKWAAAFTMRNDKGEQMQMSFGEWSDYLRTNPSFGYEYTDQAVSKAYNVANDLARVFGRI
jgi:hypothetical protein